MQKLWSKSVFFRWSVYQASTFVFVVLIPYLIYSSYIENVVNDYELPLDEKFPAGLVWGDGWIWVIPYIWTVVLILPTIWVWRKPLMRLSSFLNRVANDDSK